GGKRVSKEDGRIEAYGTVDELNSVIGVVRAFNQNGDLDSHLERLQNLLFILGADLATPNEIEGKIMRIQSDNVKELEEAIDLIDAELEPIRHFILPGGSRVAALLHFARTVCRRAERRVVALNRAGKASLTAVMFLNRLSDLLFVMARYANKLAGTGEVRWLNQKGENKKKEP
ncbi:MAG: cob(I)yrinic acid a,c-diamide adenosyltransferase, partial [Candidatus Kryptoniota bacterium]